jgi:hypothetical protein
MTSPNTFRQRYLFFIVDIQSGRRLTACAVEMFDAPNDVEATHIANSLFEACDDAFYGFKLRQGARTVATNLRDHTPLPKLDLRAVVAQRQANIRSIEETLLSTYECLWRSKKLLKEFDRQPPKRR